MNYYNNDHKRRDNKRRFAKIRQESNEKPKELLSSDTLEAINDWLANCVRYERFLINNELQYDLRQGDVFEIDYGGSVGAELKGRHYGVILHNSNEKTQTALVCPLVSIRDTDIKDSSWRINIGNLQWRFSNYESIALISQIRAIDKVRIYAKALIGLENVPEDQRPNRVPVAILTEKQMEIIIESYFKLLRNKLY
ncbi:MAG TPA: type II toxin-antitoxin system PemK/MazF family toxin [Bacilli bacterium]|jgi:mRNA-degrading endonuclease toxin of MazEF toxin-antitoxin module|nr:type II toxin-antitoxin system PemK/MazF family toxin [Bacilli bacterium]